MANLAFTTSVALHAATPLTGRKLSSRRPTTVVGASTARMSAADRFQYRSQTQEAKQGATVTGVYTVQCTEGTSGWNSAEQTRLATLAMNFRLRQASASTRYADLFATRRAAIVQAAGSHVQEGYATTFPARAAASVAGRAERLGACSRYMADADEAQGYMFRAVDRQYKQMRAGGGVYSTLCADGRVQGDADAARVSALAAQFRGGQMGAKRTEAMRYSSIQEATTLGRSCGYEEEYFEQFPKMAASMRYSNGTYAAMVNGTALVTGNKVLSVTEQINGVNLNSYWPSNLMRAAVDRKKKMWESSLKKWTPMSSAALQWGIDAQRTGEVPVPYGGAWKDGWQPTSKSLSKFVR